MNEDPVLPAYGAGGLAGVLGAVAARLLPDDDVVARTALPSATGQPVTSQVEIPVARRYVVVLVDGLGWYPLQNALADAPYLAGIFGDGYRLTSTVPSTTATAITSFTTGAAPGEHGMVGYRFRWAANRGMNALTWDGGPTSAEQSKIAEFSLVKTWFQRLAAAGVSVYDIARGKFADSGLTRVAFAGAEFVVEAHGAPRADQVAEISRSGETNLTYVYERALDHTGHPYGLNTPQWRQALIRTDAYLERLRATLDADTVLLVTGDHGMVDVGSQSRVVIEDESRLGCHLNMVEGEARFRHLYTDHPREVAARWAAFLGSRAWVCRCEEAMELGWFGTVSTAVRHRIGDVVVALRDDWAVLTRSWPGEMRLVGMHGSLTPAEMCIPLLIDKGD